MIICDDHIWWAYMMIMYDDHIWSSCDHHTRSSYTTIIYDHHIWSSHMIIIYDHHIWSSPYVINLDHHIWTSYVAPVLYWHMNQLVFRWKQWGLHVFAPLGVTTPSDHEFAMNLKGAPSTTHAPEAFMVQTGPSFTGKPVGLPENKWAAWGHHFGK